MHMQHPKIHLRYLKRLLMAHVPDVRELSFQVRWGIPMIKG